MLPSRWTRYDSLPKNANGKIDRPRLKNAFLPEPVGEPDTETPPPGGSCVTNRMADATPERS
jgi:hypothetical protein